MTLSEVQMDLFDAPYGSVLVHACNSQGVWGRGIAKAFKRRFPKAYEDYHRGCAASLGKALGIATLYRDEDYKIGCLYTSWHYAPPDKPDTILKNTEKALHSLFACYPREYIFYSNKFNSNLFRVPWKATLEVLKDVLAKHPDVDWTVCDHG